MMNKPASPMIQAARLFQNVSAKSGATYFTGRWGSLKVVLFENRSHNPDDPLQNHTHNMMLTEAAPYQPKQGDAAPTLPFPSKPPSRPDPEDIPPWDPQPVAKPYGRAYGARQPVDRFKKRAPAGGKQQLPEDAIPWMETADDLAR